MAETNLKKRLFDLLVMVDEELLTFTENLSNEEKTRVGSREKWAARDIFSHLTFWGNHFNLQLNNALKGEKIPQAGDYLDEINDGILYQYLEEPFDEIFSEYQESFNQTKKFVADISLEDLSTNGLFEFLNERSILFASLSTFGYHVIFHITDYYLKEGQPQKAITLQEKYTKELKSFPGWEANAIYNLACFYAQIGEVKNVIANLKPAFSQSPTLIEWAKHDPDLDPLREDPAFKSLFINS